MPSGQDKPATTMLQRLARMFYLDAETPGAVRRSMRWSWLGWGLAIVAPWALLVSLKLDLVAGKQAFGFLGVMWVAIVFAVASQFVARRTVRRAAAHDHLLCPDCTYDLRTLDATGTCPECGRPYDHAAVRATWLDAERRLRRGKRG